MAGGVTVYGGEDLRRISRELRAMGQGRLLNSYRVQLRAILAPLVPMVRSSIQSIPVKTEASGGLRSRLSAATRSEVRTTGKSASVTIRVDGKRMPSGQGKLPAYMEGTARPWRHPVFGNNNVWVNQQAHPYFYPVLRPVGIAAYAAVNRATADVVRKIL